MHFPKKSKQQICFYKSKMLFMNRLCLRLSCAKQTQRSESGSGFLCHVWMAEQPNFHITYSHSTFLRTQVCSFGQLPHFPLSLHLQSCSVPVPRPLPSALRVRTHGATPRVWVCKQSSQGCPPHNPPLLALAGAAEVRVSRPGAR